MIIKNGKVFIDGEFRDVDIKFDEDKIIEIGKDLKDDEVIDAKGNQVFAGLIDPHIHGGFLRSFVANTKPDTWEEYGDYETQVRYICNEVTKQGVTSVMPTFGDLSLEEYQETFRMIRKVRKDVEGADPFLIHVEGCYQNPNQSSSFNHKHDVLPTKEHSIAMCDNDFSDISIIGLAPELEGSMEWLDWLRKEHPNVHVEAGYTKASAECIIESANHGLNQTSHMFNGFETMHHRIDGPDVGIMMDDRIKCQLTLDGHHVSPYWCKFLIKTKGLDNIYGLTDLSSHSGLPDGEYHFPNGRVIIAGGGFIKDENGTIQSGNNTMEQIMYLAKNNVGLTKEEVASIFAENVAKCLDIKDRGKIEVGRRSDFTIMDDDYNCQKTIIKGKVYYSK